MKRDAFSVNVKTHCSGKPGLPMKNRVLHQIVYEKSICAIRFNPRQEPRSNGRNVLVDLRGKKNEWTMCLFLLYDGRTADSSAVYILRCVKSTAARYAASDQDIVLEQVPRQRLDRREDCFERVR